MARTREQERAERLFAEAFVAGRPQTEAYVAGHPGAAKWKRNALSARASEYARRPSVAAKVEALQREAAERAAISRDELAGMLSMEIRREWGEKASLAGVMPQVDRLARICGYDRQQLDVRAEIGAMDAEVAAERINLLLRRREP